VKKEIDSQVIVDIIKQHRGIKSAINQYDIADEYILATGDNITPRSIRRVIEQLRFEGVPILSTPHKPGGYFWPVTRGEYFDWKAREMIKAKKQIAKIKYVALGVYREFHPGIFQLAWDLGIELKQEYIDMANKRIRKIGELLF